MIMTVGQGKIYSPSDAPAAEIPPKRREDERPVFVRMEQGMLF